MSEQFQGGCHCKSIRFKVQGDPEWTGYCHCDACRRATGAPAVLHVGVRESDLKFDRKKPAIYHSSPGVKRGFCDSCGSPLTYQSDKFPGYIQVYVGTLDEPDNAKPEAHVHHQEKLSWFNIKDRLSRFKGSAAEGSAEWRASPSASSNE